MKKKRSYAATIILPREYKKYYAATIIWTWISEKYGIKMIL